VASSLDACLRPRLLKRPNPACCGQLQKVSGREPQPARPYPQRRPGRQDRYLASRFCRALQCCKSMRTLPQKTLHRMHIDCK